MTERWPASVVLALMTMTALPVAAQDPDDIINFVAIGDPHTYTGNLVNLPQVVERINALAIQPDFVISMGDNIAGHEDHEVLADAGVYHEQMSRLRAPHYYMIGNHECIPVEVYGLLTWEQLLGAWEMDSRWYSFDIKGFHVVVLDGWIALGGEAYADVFAAEQQWLLSDLAATDLPTIVFIHQAIGFQQADCPDWIATDNRKFWPPGNFFEQTIMAHADQIVGVFSGHKHKSLWKSWGTVVFHQIGASFMHDGQFAQVFIDRTTRRFFVLGHPERAERDAAWEIQQTYGDRSLMEALAPARP